MKKPFRPLTHRRLPSLLGLLAVAALIWFVGPLFAFAGVEPLGPVLNRQLTIAALVAAWLAHLAWGLYKARRDNRRVMQGMVATRSDAEARSAEEIAALKEGMDRALVVLGKARLGGKERRTLAQLPWYVIIGPPGSGKTTLLRNSGLRFPLADQPGGEDLEVKGVGGTRNCDWWFTDEAVLLDTAGRYATQDIHQEVDRAAWLGFLDLLKKRNRRRPLNGVLVAVALAEVLSATEAQRTAHVAAIRQRLEELHDRLGVRFPVYFLFTKCDLLAGFAEFFDDLGKDARAQVWGTTLPLTEGGDEQGAVAAFPAEFDALARRLGEHLTRRLQEERDPARRALVYGFPHQFAGIEPVLAEFLDALFHPSRFETAPLLRGIYFTSATQEGTPIDRLMRYFATGFGIPATAPAAVGGRGKSYFIHRLLRDLVFAEADLAGTNLRFERWRTWLQRTGFALVAAGVVLTTGLWVHSYTQNRAYVERVATEAEGLRGDIEALPAGRVLELAEVRPILDRARDIPGAVAKADAEIPADMDLGLYQGEKIDPEARRAYRRLLEKLLLPTIILHLEAQLRGAFEQPELRYEALRVYLMLDDPEHYDPATLEAWIQLDWQRRLGRHLGSEGVTDLVGHLHRLFEVRPARLPIELDGDLVERVRARLARRPLAERIYAAVRAAADRSHLPPFSVGEAGGKQAPLVFLRRSGEPLSEGIPGFYTARGYREIFARTAQQMGRTVLDEHWVLGKAQPVPTDPRALADLFRRVETLYLEDYAEHWRTLLDDLALVPFGNETQAAEALRILSGRDSPLARLLAEVEENTTLRRPDALEAKREETDGALAAARKRLAGLFGDEPEAGAAPPPPEANLVDREFASLNALVRGPEGRPARLDTLLEQLKELYVYVDALASVADRGGAALEAARERTRAAGVVGRLRREAGRQPAPLDQWLTDLTGATDRVIQRRTTAHLNALWGSEVVAFYRTAIEGRYPIFKEAAREIALEDFARFFGPEGAMDRFFQTNLQPFVDTSGRRWRLHSAAKGAPAVSRYALEQLQNAAAIRRAFFPAGATTPTIRFDLRPVRMDASITRFTLDLDGQRLGYSHGPVFPTQMVWPGPGGLHQVYLEMSPKIGRSSLTERSRWAWFRLLDRARIETADQPDRFRLTLDLDGRKVTYELWAGSVYNPFHLPALGNFRCPTTLQAER